jgi:hypothetical protein
MERRIVALLVIIAAAGLSAGCEEEGSDGDADADGDGDTDTDVDVDGDGDVDADGDTDGDADGDTDGGVEDACQDAEDLSILATVDVQGIMTACSLGCIGDPNPSACVGACIVEDSGLTEDCAGCFVGVFECVSASCLEQCMTDPTGDECIACTTESCAPGFEDCSGVPFGGDEGFCLGEADLDALESHDMEAEMLACAEECVEADDPAECGGECIEDIALTEGCAGCFGDLIGCGIEECDTECADLESRECWTCAFETCGERFESCSGLPLEPGDLCLNEEDFTVLTEADVDGALGSCGLECMLSPDPSACLDACIVRETGLSSLCTSCFSDMIVCTGTACAAQCLPPGGSLESEECMACVETSCGDGFEACSGLPLFPDEPACIGEDDAAILAERDEWADLVGCGLTCLAETDVPLCIHECMVETTGLTEGCVECFDGAVLCGSEECLTDCSPETGDPESEECRMCLVLSCGPEFVDCSGAPMTPPEPLCTGTEDAAALEAADLPAAMATCVTECEEDPDILACAHECLAEQVGTGDECTTCLVDLASCGAIECALECTLDPTDPACIECTTEACGDRFFDCAGVPIDPAG